LTFQEGYFFTDGEFTANKHKTDTLHAAEFFVRVVNCSGVKHPVHLKFHYDVHRNLQLDPVISYLNIICNLLIPIDIFPWNADSLIQVFHFKTMHFTSPHACYMSLLSPEPTEYEIRVLNI
jgi:hypothetical protein